MRLIKSLPVNLIYKYGKKRFDKSADLLDRKLAELLEEKLLQDWFPKNEIPKGDKTSDPFGKGIHFDHQFYTKRDLSVIAFFWSRAKGLRSEASLKLCITSLLLYSSKLSRWRQANQSGPLNLTLYVASMIMPLDAFTILPNRVKRIVEAKKTLLKTNHGNALITNASSTEVLVKDESVDYIFIDPPFGANIMYSELNQMYESWLKVRTNNRSEAIENRTQKKSASEYQYLMTQSFREYFRTLKPGKWMTVEFSNTSAAVWNGIQTSLQRAGFVVANVSGLDKMQGSFNAVNNVTSVKQDLVISCYKPTAGFAQLFATQTGEVAVWEFVQQHLHHLPIHLRKGNSTTAVVERSPKILYDRLITFYLMRKLPVPIDAPSFQAGLRQRFTERDGMIFLPEQAAEYDRKKATAPEFVQLSLIVSTGVGQIAGLSNLG